MAADTSIEGPSPPAGSGVQAAAAGVSPPPAGSGEATSAEPEAWATLIGTPVLFLAGAIVGYLLALPATALLTRIGSASPHPPPLKEVLFGPAGLPMRTVTSLWFTAACTALAVVASVRGHPLGWRERLGLRRGRIPAQDLPAIVAANFGAFGLGLVLLEALRAAGVRLPATDAFRELFLSMRSAGPVLGATFVFGGSVLVGVEEELLFRGFLQRRLLRAWHPAAALLVTALFFDLAHVLPARLIGLLGSCLWLGYLAWRADSIVPGIVCHACLNAVAQSIGMFSTWTMELHRPGVSLWGLIGSALVSLALVGLGVFRVERRVRTP